MSKDPTFPPEDLHSRSPLQDLIDSMQTRCDKLTQDYLQELFKRKRALLEAAMAYNAVAHQTGQEVVNLTFGSGRQFYAIQIPGLPLAAEPKIMKTYNTSEEVDQKLRSWVDAIVPLFPSSDQTRITSILSDIFRDREIKSQLAQFRWMRGDFPEWRTEEDKKEFESQMKRVIEEALAKSRRHVY